MVEAAVADIVIVVVGKQQANVDSGVVGLLDCLSSTRQQP